MQFSNPGRRRPKASPSSSQRRRARPGGAREQKFSTSASAPRPCFLYSGPPHLVLPTFQPAFWIGWANCWLNNHPGEKTKPPATGSKDCKPRHTIGRTRWTQNHPTNTDCSQKSSCGPINSHLGCIFDLFWGAQSGPLFAAFWTPRVAEPHPFLPRAVV